MYWRHSVAHVAHLPLAGALDGGPTASVFVTLCLRELIRKMHCYYCCAAACTAQYASLQGRCCVQICLLGRAAWIVRETLGAVVVPDTQAIHGKLCRSQTLFTCPCEPAQVLPDHSPSAPPSSLLLFMLGCLSYAELRAPAPATTRGPF
jgi:hypothetical protein